MNCIKRIGLCIVLMSAFCLAGCQSSPVSLGSPQDDWRAKTAAVRPGKAQIFVYRHESLGFAVPITVKLDGYIGGRTVAQTYVMWEVEPGRHQISSHAEDASALTLDAEPGKSYYIWQEVRVGVWKPRSSLHRVDEQTGRQFIAACKLAQA